MNIPKVECDSERRAYFEQLVDSLSRDELVDLVAWLSWEIRSEVEISRTAVDAVVAFAGRGEKS